MDLLLSILTLIISLILSCTFTPKRIEKLKDSKEVNRHLNEIIRRKYLEKYEYGEKHEEKTDRCRK